MARKQKTIHYIYKTTCLITSRYYIGMHSTNNLEDGYMGSGKRLRYSIRKHGVENHVREILEYFDTRELLVEGEKKAITLDMITDNNCMNLMSGGTGGYVSLEACTKGGKISGKRLSERMKCDEELRQSVLKKISEKSKIRWVDPELRVKMGNNLLLGRQGHSEETKKKMSETKKGKTIGEKNSQYGTCWITRDGMNKKIKKEDIEGYLAEGWVKGRLIL